MDVYKELRVCSERVALHIVAIFINVRIQHALKFKGRQLMDLVLKKKCRKIITQIKHVNMQSLKMLTLNGAPYVVSCWQLSQ